MKSGTIIQKHAIFSATSCICHDQRVLKMAATVATLGYRITIVGRQKDGCCKREELPFKAIRFRMLFRKGFMFYKWFNIRLFIYLLFHSSDLLVSNDLDTLLPNFLVAKLKRIPLIYDSHEYFTGVPELQNRPFVRSVWKSIERWIFPHLDNIITVSESIALRYLEEYCKKPVIVRNFAPKSDHIAPFTREELKIRQSDLLLILQGTGINIHRGGEELVEAVLMTDDIFLLVIGSGDSVGEMKKIAGSSARIRFVDPLPWEQMLKYTKAADAGLSLDMPTNDNYRFSLPNKLFDYFSAGIPVIAGDVPEVSKIIGEYGCGLILESVSPQSVSSAIKDLNSDRMRLEQMRLNAIRAGRELSWETEQEKVRNFYLKILNEQESKSIK